MKIIYIFVFILFLFFAASAGCAEDGDMVVDPYQEEGFSCTGEPDGGLDHHTYGYGRFRIVTDLNFDDKEDIILRDGAGCGNGGCSVAIYLQQTGGSYLKKEFALHPLAVNLKKINSGEGKLTIYWHMNAEEGSLTSYKITQNSIKSMSSKIIHSGDSSKDEKLYNSLFGEDSRLKPEFAWCKNGKIQWSE